VKGSIIGHTHAAIVDDETDRELEGGKIFARERT